MKKFAIVLGGAGFIGSHLVEKLYELNYDILVVDDFSREDSCLKTINAKYILNVCSFENIFSEEIEKADVIFHLAAFTSVEESLNNPTKYIKNNTSKTIQLLDKKPPIIFSSTSAVYGNTDTIPTTENSNLNPMSPYALSKLQVESIMPFYEKIGLKYNILRYFNVYGERQHETGGYVNVISSFLSSIKNNKPLKIFGSGENSRDFIYVKDVVEANILASEKINNSIYNVGSGKTYKIIDIANLLSNNFSFLPPRIEPKTTVAEITKIKKELGWEPKTNLVTWLTGK